MLACSDAEESGYVKARRKTWAQLLARVSAVDALRCELCGGRRRIIAWITDPEAIERFPIALSGTHPALLSGIDPPR